MKQLDEALEELRGLRRGATPRPLTPPPGTQDEPMDVDTDENAHVSIASTSAQNNVHALQRVPTYVYKAPCTPLADSIHMHLQHSGHLDTPEDTPPPSFHSFSTDASSDQ